jgi:iron(III) transport system ATP-binding protein
VNEQDRERPALTLERVTKRYGATVALDGVELSLGPRELLVLVGPSGCGKSTLLRVVGGLLAVDAGVVRLGDTVVDDGRLHVPPERRHVGLVFQDHALFPHLTVARNVGFGLGRRGRAGRGRVDEVLDLVGMVGLRDRYPHELSGGERQRVALARALAPHPSLLLLDEPFASLDPNLRAQIRSDVVDILHNMGTPAVFVTHDQDEALAIGDRVAVMRSGRLRQVAEPWEVFHRPADRFVASFMGEASFLELTEAGSVLRTDFGDVARPPGDLPDGSVAMVRPDDITFTVDPDGCDRIVHAEFRGSSWCYTIQLGSGSTLRSMRSHLLRVDVGERVTTSISPGHAPVLVPPDVE